MKANASRSRRIIMILIMASLMTGISRYGYGQTNGDYQSRATGNWNSNATWQKYSGGAWVNCGAGDYPGATAGAGMVTVRAPHTVTFNTSPANSIGELIIQSNLTYNGTYTLTVTGDFSISAGTLNLSSVNARNGTLNIGGDFSISGGIITESANRYGVIVFNKSGTQTYVKTAGTISNDIRFTVNSGSDLDMGSYVLNGSGPSFTLSSGATLTTAHEEGISVSPTLSGCIQVTGTRTFNTGANYTYNGTSAQITGSGLPATVNNLTINNPAGLTLTNNLTVTNTLTMTQGNIVSGTNSLILSGSILNHTNGTITGKFQRAVTATGTEYLFPVGTASDYNPLKIAFSNLVSGQLAVQFLPDDIGNAGLPLNDAGNEIFDRHTTGYWRMTATGSMASTNYNIILNYNGFTGVDAMARILKLTDGGNLILDGTHGSVASPEITRTAMNGISTTTTDLAIGKASVRIVTHPSDATGCNSVFTVVASGKTPLTYKWQEDNGTGFADITDGGVYSGSATAVLTLTGATVSMNGYRFRCIVTDSFGNTATSNSAQLTVTLTVVSLGYNYSTDITLDAASGSSDLNDFPVLLSITTSPDRDRLRTVANGGHVENSNGYDIIFTDQAGSKLDHQTEAYDATTGQYVGWVRIPVLSSLSTTTIKMLYGNPAISSDQSVKSVWSSNYKGIWHLNGSDYTDATINGNNGTPNATVNVAGKIAGAKDFNGTTSYIITPTNGMTGNDNNQTISVWGYYTVTPSGNRNFITFQNAGLSSAIQLGFRGGNTVAWKWGGVELVNAGAAPSINTWHYYVYTFDGVTSRLFIDGVQRATSTVAPQTAIPNECNIGRYNDGEYIDAIIDEPRFSMSTKSADWILTEYTNQFDPAGFISVGAENSATLLATVGACVTDYSLDQGYPAGGTYSGTGVSGTTFNASAAGVGTHSIYYSYTDVYGCSNITSKDIIVTAIPSAPVAVNKECCYLNIVDLEATGTNTKWYTDAGLTQLAGTGTPFPTGKTTSGVYTYYVTQTINGCQSAATTVTLTIGNGITINSQPQPAAICEGDNASFSVSATGYNLSYIWQEDEVNISDGGIYSGAATATLILTNPGTINNGKTYRCIITTSCGASPVNTNDALLTVIPLPVATFSYAGTPYCPNAVNPLPTFSGGGIAGTFSSGTGLVFVSTSTGEIDIAASTPGSYTVTNTVTAPGGCGEVSATSPFEILTNLLWTGAVNTDWNEPGNWTCNYIPNSAMSVQIPDVANEPVLSLGADAAVNNLTINPGSALTINGNTINISGAITNNGTLTATAGTVEMSGSVAQTIGSGVFTNNTVRNLIINNTAGVTLLDSLRIIGIMTLQNGNLTSGGFLTLLSSDTLTAMIAGTGSGSVTGNVVMQRYLPSGFGYKYFSSPFQSATVNEFSDDMSLGTTFSMFYRYDESRTSSGWVSYNNPANILNPLNGYAANFGSGNSELTADIRGEVNNGPLSVTLYNNNNTYTKGFNLVGNPYPSPIDWNAPSGWTKTNIDDALYYFKASTTDQYGGTYSTYINKVSSDGSATNIIPSMQGFFVHVSDGSYPVTGTLGLNNDVRKTDLSHPFLKSGETSSLSFIRLIARFTDDTTTNDPAVIYLDTNASFDFEGNLDALKLYNTDLKVPNLYSLSSDISKLSINALPFISDSAFTVPLGLKTNRNGTIAFRILNLGGEFSGKEIVLSDLTADTEQNLLPDKEYKIYLGSGLYENRFFLNFRTLKTGLPEKIVTSDLFKVYFSENVFKADIFHLPGISGTLKIYNLTGQLLYMKNILYSGHYEFDAGIEDGIYLITFCSGPGFSTKKIIVQKR